MKEHVHNDESFVDKYGYRRLQEAEKRLDLNDLLKRAEDKKKSDRKFNLLIVCGALCLTLAVYFIFSLSL